MTIEPLAASDSAVARFIIGDALTVLRTLPDASVDLVLTSPPFLALRSYLPPDHPDKAKEIGQETGPGTFVDSLLDIVEECRRVLAPHGSLCFELGDTYSGSGGSGGDYNEGGWREGQAKWQQTARSAGEPSSRIPWRTNDAIEEERNQKLRVKGNGFPDRDSNPRPNRNGRRVRSEDEASGILAARSRPGPEGRDNVDGWPLDKSLCLVAEIFRFALVYGFNPLTGRQTPRWRARNVIRWCRPNPPVGALGDKVRPATSDMVVVAMSRRRYFDLDAVRTPLTEPGAIKKHSTQHHNERQGWGSNNAEIRQNENGAPPLDHCWFDDTFDQDAWLISTSPYKGSHYATWPPELLDKPIEAMCPHRVCRTCGKPSERITAPTEEYAEYLAAKAGRKLEPTGTRKNRIDGSRRDAEVLTTGWTDCGHDNWRSGVVLDPFAGSGTTLAVAVGHGRAAIGIDLDERNARLAEQRVGMFLEVEGR